MTNPTTSAQNPAGAEPPDGTEPGVPTARGRCRRCGDLWINHGGVEEPMCWDLVRPKLHRQIALDPTEMPCPACRRGECEQPSGRYIVTATYEAVVIAHSHEEALTIADDAKYDHRVESMRIVHGDTADVRWPDA